MFFDRSAKIIGAGLLALSLSGPALANEGTNLADGKGDGGGVVADRHLASQLYSYGVEAQDPLAVIMALRIAVNRAGEPVELVSDTEPATRTGGEAASDASGDDALPTEEAMVAMARNLAADNDAYQNLIDEILSNKTRGAVGGPQYAKGQVRPGLDEYYWVTFRGNELAEVGLDGGGDNDLDLYIYDQNGNLVCESAVQGDVEYCSWYPRWTGPFKILVSNYANRVNTYYLLTN